MKCSGNYYKRYLTKNIYIYRTTHCCNWEVSINALINGYRIARSFPLGERYCRFERKGLRRHVKAEHTRKYTATPLVAAIPPGILNRRLSQRNRARRRKRADFEATGQTTRAAPPSRKRTRGISWRYENAHPQADYSAVSHAASRCRCPRSVCLSTY